MPQRAGPGPSLGSSCFSSLTWITSSTTITLATGWDALTDITGLDYQDLRRRWWHDEGEWKAEAGDPDTGDEYLRRVNESFDSSITREDWVSMRKEAMVFKPEVLSAVEFATQHGQVTLLTNNGMLIGEHLAEVAPHLAPVFGNHPLCHRPLRSQKAGPPGVPKGA